MIIFWILVIAAIFLGVRWAVKNNKSTSGPDRSGSAMDVLKERYASGEINRETFMNMKKDLEN